MSKYNSRLIRRRVRRTDLVKGQQNFITKSFTRADVVHLPVIDLEAGTVFCSCEDFRFRHAKHEPTVNDCGHHCKHISFALKTCVHVGQLQPVKTENAAPVLVPAQAPVSSFTLTAEQRSASLDAKLASGALTYDDLL